MAPAWWAVHALADMTVPTASMTGTMPLTAILTERAVRLITNG